MSKPLGITFAMLTRQYISVLSKRLSHIPLERYYYPFWLISQENGKIGQQQLVDQLQTDKVAVVRIIDYLEKEGFVKRKTNPDDRRCHLLEITPKGKSLAPEISKAIDETNKLFLSIVDADFADKFASQIEQLGDRLKEIPGERIALYYDKIATKND